MKISKHEQSGFVFDSEFGCRMALDIGAYTPTEDLKTIEPVEHFLVSHLHGDHFSPEHIKGLSSKTAYLSAECKALLPEGVPFDVKVIKSGVTTEIGVFRATPFDVDHGPNTKVRPKENFGFYIEDEDFRKIYFAGDMFYPSGIEVGQLEVDYALIPIGGFYTFGPQEAFEFAKKFKKIRTLIPMHYEKTPETLEQFIKLAGSLFNIEEGQGN